MSIYRNIAGSNVITPVLNELERLSIPAYDDMVVHQIDNDQIYIFSVEVGNWELVAGPTAILGVGISNGLSIGNNQISLSLANSTNAGAMSSQDYIKLSNISESATEVFTLTATNIAEAKVSLNRAPSNPRLVAVIPDGGIEQRYGVDYTVVGNDIIWSSMGLDGFLEENDVIRIYY